MTLALTKRYGQRDGDTPSRRLPALALAAGVVIVAAAGLITLHHSSGHHAAQAAPAAAEAGLAPSQIEEAPPPNSLHLTEQQAVQTVLQTLSGAGLADPQAVAPDSVKYSSQPVSGTSQAVAATGWTRADSAASEQQPASDATGWVAAAPQAAAAARVPQAPVSWPVLGPITSFFGPSHPLGIDIGANAGVPIRAAAAGRIAYVGGDPCCSYGYRVDIDHGNGVLTRYGHMLYLPALTVGEPVRMGDIIGLVGSTGFSTGPHLHFEVRLNDMVVDPLLVLPRQP